MSDWERLDAPAAVPNRSSGRGDAAMEPSIMRLRRSRNPALAAFDAGGRAFQRRLRDLMLGAALILVPAVALNVWITLVSVARVESDASVPVLFDDGTTGTEDLAVFLAYVFVSATPAVVGYFAATIVIGDRFGRSSSLGAALLSTLRRSPAVLAAWVLTHWWFIAMAALVAPAGADGLTLVFFLSFLVWPASTATLLVIPVMVGERLGPYRAAVRGWRLVKQRFLSGLGFVALSAMLAALFGTGLSSMIPLLDVFGFLALGDAASIVVGVSIQLAVVFIVPLVAAATAQFYIEMRVAAEGLDLAIDLDAAFADSSAR